MGIMDAVEGIGYALDTPRALAHGAVANIADAVRGRKSRDSWRASGRDMLESLGVLDANQEGLDAGDVAGMGAEMFLDPLNLVGAGIATKLLKGNKLRNLTKKIPKTFNESKYLAQLADEIPVDAKVVPEIGGVGAPEIAALMGNSPKPMAMPDLRVNDPLGKLRAAAARMAPAKAPAASVAKQPWVRPDIKPGDPLLYSRLERAVEALPDRPMKAQSVINQIKKYPEGVSQEEIDWTDVAGYLKGNTIVDKQDLLNHVKTNRPKINLTRRGGAGSDNSMYEPYVQGKQSDGVWQLKNNGGIEHQSYLESLFDLENPKRPKIEFEHPEGNKAFYKSEYGSIIDSAGREAEPGFHVYDRRGEWSGSFDSLDEAKNAVKGFADKMPAYKSHNFPHRPNLLLHARSTTRKTPIGKMLLGEEQQSDWLQEASKFGFKDEPLRPAKWVDNEDLPGARAVDSQYGFVDDGRTRLGDIETPYNASMHPPFDVGGGEYKQGFASIEEAKQYILDKAEANKHVRPPQAPMLGSWPELALKQHLIDAASDPSVKYVGLPSGEDVAAVVGGEAGGQAQFYNKDQVARLKKLLKPFGVDVEDVAGAVAKHPGADARAEKVSALLKKTKDRRDKSGSYTNDYRFTDAIAKMLDRHGYNVGGDRGVNDLVNNPIPKEQLAKNLKESLADKFQRRYGAAKLAKITPEMRKQILTKGFPLMSPLAAALLAPALMDRDES